MDIIDFLPTYTEFDKDVETILGPDLVDTTSLYHKKEFHDFRLQAIEKRPEKPGEYMNHQIIMARFLSSYTPYNGILVMHEPGTGKTCVSVAVIEKIRSEKSSFRGALILMKGKNLIENYKKELVEKCTDGRYKINDDEDGDEKKVGYDNPGSLTANKVRRRINKKLEKFYQFQTFETFSKQLSKMSDKDIIKNYSNIVIVIDEAHHLRIVNERGVVDHELKGQYTNIHRLLHLVKNTKTILMTGTPMIDSPSEIASLMNLILGMDKQLPTGKKFEESYMKRQSNGDFVIDPDKANDLKDRLHGKVSFLRSMQSSVKREFIGKKLDLHYFNQFGLEMKPFQQTHYQVALQRDREEKGIYTYSRQASLFVFPDGKYGADGFKFHTLILKNKITGKSLVKINKTMTDVYKGKTIAEKLDILSTFSIKYATCIKLLLENEGNHFVYMDFVQGSGAIIFAELLKEFGFSHFMSSGKGNKFALLTSKTSSEINDAIRLFNSDANIKGERIKVIIGTKVISEGFSLKNVRHVHILTPHWNFSETDQAIARAFRLFSHNALEKIIPDIVVKIYLYTVFMAEQEKLENVDDFLSIDRYMYKFCEDKDISIKSVEHLLKQVSFDCRLTKERNRLPPILDMSRNCEYQKCDYMCYEEDEDEEDKEDEEDEDKHLDESTYHIFYSKDDISSLVERIKGTFDDKSSITLFDMYKQYKDTSYHLFIQSILYTIENKIIIKTVYGIDLYLHYSKNVLYLSFNIYDSTIFDVFYTRHIPLQLEFNFNTEINKLYGKYLPTLFERLKVEKDKDVKKTILDKFSKNAKELMIEIAILSVEKGYTDKVVDPIRAFIIAQFASYVFKSGDMTVSSFLGKKNYRCLKNKSERWDNCPLHIKQPVEKQELNEYGYEGLYDAKGVFKIKEQQKDIPRKSKKKDKDDGKEVKEEKDEDDDKDTRKVNKGVKCVQSVPKKKLLAMIYTFKIKAPSDYKQDKKSDEELKRWLVDNPDIDVEKIDVKKLSRHELIRMHYWTSENKKALCGAIENFFKEKQIITK